VRTAKHALARLYLKLPLEGVTRPVFIIGCGRSGTTILGTALGHHRQVTYLNEPRHLWFTAFPEADIWTVRAPSRHGRLVLTAADADPEKSRTLKRLFQMETLKRRRPVLIEKLPINNFRLGLIRAIFPDARFIHIYRNGLEVARSIEKESERGRWFAAYSYKWDQLVRYAQSKDDTSALPEICTSFYEKGLLEWRLSTEVAVAFLKGIPQDSFIEISYESLIDNPVETVAQVQRFIGIEDDPEVTRFVSKAIQRRSIRLHPPVLSEKEQAIGGDLLPRSLSGGAGLTAASA
jgi:hypothetical protein